LPNPFNALRVLDLGQLLPHIHQDVTIGLGDLTAILLMEGAVGDPDHMATAECTVSEIKQNKHEFSQYYAEFQVIAADINWNRSVLRHTLCTGL